MDRAISALARLEAATGATFDARRWLEEDSPEYAGLAADEADWLRGHVYAWLARHPAQAVPLARLREDLQTSSSPQVLAGIARCLRHMAVGADWLTDLHTSAGRMALTDRYPAFRFDPPATCCAPALTCREELEKTIDALTGLPGGDLASAEARDQPSLVHVEIADIAAHFEDQDASLTTMMALLSPGPALIVPFYTRCMNPLKCSLAITRLGQAARLLPDISLYGLSYDPAWDTPYRLRSYGADRDFDFGPRARLLRGTQGWEDVAAALGLRVGYGAATVNSHARELFLMTPDGRCWTLPSHWLAQPETIRNFSLDLTLG